MNKIYLIAGVPASGKSWVCEQMAGSMVYLPHDGYSERPLSDYISDADTAANRLAGVPVLIETPFSISQIMGPLMAESHEVQLLVILEKPEVLAERYKARNGKEYPKGNYTRQDTYRDRAEKWGCFSGNSSQVLAELKRLVG